MLDLLQLLELYVPDIGKSIEVIGIILLLLGIANAFFGYKLFRLMLIITGFFAGMAVGLIAVLVIGESSTVVVEVGMIIGGIIGAALAKEFHALGVFLAVGLIGAGILFLITQNKVISLVVGAICGIIGIFAEEYIIIISSVIYGGNLFAKGVWIIGISNGEDKNVQVIGWIIGICGAIFQLWMEGVIELGFIRELIKWIVSIANKNDFTKQLGITLHNLIYKKDSNDVNTIKFFGDRNVKARPRCQNCGMVLGGDAGFCGNCGSAVQKKENEEYKLCTRCGTKLQGKARFCNNCGMEQN